MMRFLIGLLNEMVAIVTDMVIVMMIIISSIAAFFTGLACVAAALSLSGLTPITLIVLIPFFILSVGVACLASMIKIKEFQ